jgi:dienelactone hydrolase
VQVAVWYPAASATGPVTTYADYLRLAAAETTAVDTAQLGRKNIDAACAFLLSRSVPESAIVRWFMAPMLAVRDAPPASGRFPLVLVAQGNRQSAGDQSMLGEYLASYGYVVVTSPSQARITGQPDDESKVGLAAVDQAADLVLIRSAAERRDDVRLNGVGVVGHSFGARSALLYAMHDSTVRGLVSLDGGIGTATARAAFEGVEAFRPAAARLPILHFYETLDAPMTPDWEILRSLASRQVWIARTTNLHHHHFSVLGAASAVFPEVGRATGAKGPTGREYAAVVELTRRFLDATLRGDALLFPPTAPDSNEVPVERLPR